MADVPDFQAFANQIAVLTAVDFEPKTPLEPGETVFVRVIPGFLPVFPAFEPTGAVGGGIGGILNTTTNAVTLAVKPVTFTVSYKVVDKDGNELKHELKPLSTDPLGANNPLQVTLRIPPPFLDERKVDPRKPLVECFIVVSVKIAVAENFKAQREFRLRCFLLGIPLPSLLLLNWDADHKGKLVIVARAGSPTNVTEIVGKLNSLIQVVNGLKDLLSWGDALDVFLGGIGEAVGVISKAIEDEGVAGVALEEAADLEDYDDSDDEISSSLLIGPVGTQVTFYSGQDFNQLAGGQNEASVFVIEKDLTEGKAAPLSFGIHRKKNWQNVWWGSDPPDPDDPNADFDAMNDNCESCNFGFPKGPVGAWLPYPPFTTNPASLQTTPSD